MRRRDGLLLVPSLIAAAVRSSAQGRIAGIKSLERVALHALPGAEVSKGQVEHAQAGTLVEAADDLHQCKGRLMPDSRVV